MRVPVHTCQKQNSQATWAGRLDHQTRQLDGHLVEAKNKKKLMLNKYNNYVRVYKFTAINLPGSIYSMNDTVLRILL